MTIKLQHTDQSCSHCTRSTQVPSPDIGVDLPVCTSPCPRRLPCSNSPLRVQRAGGLQAVSVIPTIALATAAHRLPRREQCTCHQNGRSVGPRKHGATRPKARSPWSSRGCVGEEAVDVKTVVKCFCLPTVFFLLAQYNNYYVQIQSSA